MTNDLNTLSGALLEMKDQLIYELGQKGVTASYDSSTGLLGLIGEISNIQQGGGSCYHIEFSESSYTAVGGTATLEVYLQSNYAPLANATVTVTGSDSSLYTGITNSSGVAEVTVTNVSAETTFTATYQNVSATCTVNVQSYIFRDGGVTGDVNTNYTNINNRCIIATDNNGTTVSSNTNADSFYRENALIQGDFRATFTIVAVNVYGELVFLNTSNTNQFMVGYDLWSGHSIFKLYIGSNEYTLSNDTSFPQTITMERVGTTITVKQNGTQVGSSQTVTSADGYLAWKTHRANSRSIKFKDFTIEAL